MVICARCKEEYTMTGFDKEPTKYCDDCAHKVVEELQLTINRLAEWTHEFGAALCPWSAPGSVDSFGDGIRAAKSQVARIIAARHEFRCSGDKT